MKISVSTSILQSLVARSMKGASCSNMIPLTNFMMIELENNTLTLCTTDATNYLYVSQDKIMGDNFYVVVQAQLFSQLISKLTCDTVTMEIKDRSLLVTGNGKYTMELPLDEEGELVKFPDPVNNLLLDTYQKSTANLSTFKTILSTAKAALATTLENPCYTGYYVGHNVAATDMCKVCGIDISVWDTDTTGGPALIAPEMLDLFEVFTEENIDVYRDDDVIVFCDSYTLVYGKVMDCISDYQIDAINSLVEDEFPSVCKIAKAPILALLDRLSLFVGIYDKKEIYLTFTNEGMLVQSKRSNSSELIPYLESSQYKSFTCCINIEMLRSQIKANSADAFYIHYGKDNAIKLVDGKITQVIALSEDDREDADSANEV